MAGIKIVDLPALGRDLASTDLFEMSIGGTASRKITGQEIMNASKLNVGATPIVSGTVGRLLFQGTGNVLQQSLSLFWDNTNERAGFGTSTPLAPLHVVGNATSGFDAIRFKGQYSETGYLATSNGAIYLASGAGVTGSFLELSSSTANLRGGTTAVTFTVASERMRINNAGNVLINTTTDAGFRLDVNGTARVQSGLANNSSSTAFQVTGASGSLLRMRGFGDLYLEGSTPTLFLGSSGTFVSNGSANFYSTQGAGNTFFSVVHNNSNVAIRALSNSNVLLNPSAGNVLIGTTTDDGYRLDVNGISRVKGNLQLTTANPTINMQVGDNTQVVSLNMNATDGAARGGLITNINTGEVRLLASFGGYFLTFFSNNTERMRIPATGNLLINTTTDAGYKVDVNGTMRVTGKVTLNGQLDTNQTGAGHVFSRINDNGTLIRIFNWNYGNSSGNTWVGGSEVASALFALNSTTTGFLPPRMTNAQRTAIVSPAVGLIVYCTDATEGLWVYKSTGWTFIV